MLLYAILLFASLRSVCLLQCVDQNKNPVEWFVVYKLPTDEKHPNGLIKQGAAYTFITSLDHKNWTLSNISINDTQSIIGLNLEPYFKEQSTLHVFYNDETPDGSVNFKKGHTKGVVLGGPEGGVWLVHSVPRFPPTNSKTYYYPHNGYTYGQTFLCLSLDLANLDKVGTQLQYNLPHIYSQEVAESLKGQLPRLDEVVRDITVSSAPWNHLGLLEGKSGTKFFSFAKSTKFNKELYADWVAPVLNVSLLAETWLNGPGRIPSQCEQRFSVNNVLNVSVASANFEFKCSNDHSKWAVVTKDNPLANWICIGDINRAVSQRQRGGGTVCFNNPEVARIYQDSVVDVEPCPKEVVKFVYL